MLTVQCKKVLYQLKKLTNNSNAEFCYLLNTACFCLSDDTNQTYDYSEYSNEINSIMTHLILEGYAKNTFNDLHFRLTQKAIHIQQFRFHILKIYVSEKWISIIALIISALSLLKSYGCGIDDVFNACMQLLKK